MFHAPFQSRHICERASADAGRRMPLEWCDILGCGVCVCVTTCDVSVVCVTTCNVCVSVSPVCRLCVCASAGIVPSSDRGLKAVLRGDLDAVFKQLVTDLSAAMRRTFPGCMPVGGWG